MRSSRELILPIFATLTSFLGAWFAASIVASLKMPIGLILLAGFIFLPVLPIVWFIYQESRIRRIWKYRIPFLTYRISWRVLTINLGLITTLLVVSPQFALNALRQYSDSILGDLRGENVETVRTTLRQAANETADSLEQVRSAITEIVSPYIPIPPGPYEPVGHQWPWHGTGVHPIVKNMPSSVEVSITEVANYIAAQEPDTIQRIKALHDYVATRIKYDADAFFSGNIPDQSPARVFQTHKAVCQGYADLLTALGRAIGIEIITLDGYSRGYSQPNSNEVNFESNHAWNAVNSAEGWHLLDPTWDSGYLNESGVWQQQYKTDYLMVPPDVMVHDHFPSDSTWQLLDRPFMFTEFKQLPNLDPRFFAEGFQLITPTHRQTKIEGTAKIQLENPKHRYFLANYVEKNNLQEGKCNLGQPIGGSTISCRFPHPGQYEVTLYSASAPYGQSYLSIGKLEFDFRT